MIWRWRLEKSTMSKSTMPILPMPAAARYIAIGDPSPPAPMQRTLVEQIFFWPARPTSGRIKWREYRRIWSLSSSIKTVQANEGNAEMKYFKRPKPAEKTGAGGGNRTRIASLEDWHSTTELRPQRR